MLNISRQAYVYTVIFGITTIINLILSIFIGGAFGPLFYIIFSLLSFPFVLLAIYNIDCLTTGGCNIWSWIYTVLTSLSMIMLTLMSIGIVAFSKA